MAEKKISPKAPASVGTGHADKPAARVTKNARALKALKAVKAVKAVRNARAVAP
jgi:hypothetical protein